MYWFVGNYNNNEVKLFLKYKTMFFDGNIFGKQLFICFQNNNYAQTGQKYEENENFQLFPQQCCYA